MSKTEEFWNKVEAPSWKDGELLDLARDMIENLEIEVSKWKTIAYNLADESQIRERLSDEQIKTEIGIEKEDLEELFEE